MRISISIKVNDNCYSAISDLFRGGDVTISAGNGGATGSGGEVRMYSGTRVNTSSGGDATISAGNSGTTSGGEVRI